jgi:hypothetical protein
MGDVRGRELRMKIGLNRKGPEKKEKDQADPGTPQDLFRGKEETPQRQEPQKGREEYSCGEGNFETAQVKPDAVGEKHGNERKAECLTHLDPQEKTEYWNSGVME